MGVIHGRQGLVERRPVAVQQAGEQSESIKINIINKGLLSIAFRLEEIHTKEKSAW